MASEISVAHHNSTLPLQDRVTIVTGSSRRIGWAIALHLASLGAKIVVNYVCNDVSDATQVKSLFDVAEQTFYSPVHILVNSAAVADPKRSTIAQISLEDFDRIFREAANRLRRGGGGRIILLSSSLVASLKSGSGSYTASKVAVETMTKVLAEELKGTGITANCIAPGPIATDMLFAGRSKDNIKELIDECPMGRLGETEDVASGVGFLTTDASEWINGQVICAIGGSV